MLLKKSGKEIWISTHYNEEYNETIRDLTTLIRQKKLEIDADWLKRAYSWVDLLAMCFDRKPELNNLDERWIESQIEAILASLSGLWYYYYESDDFMEGFTLVHLTDAEKVTF